MDEVFPDMPKLQRNPKFVELDGEVNAIYEKEQEAFAEYFDLNKDDVDFMSNILAKMAKLRHITSLAKIDLCVDTVMEFLYSNDRKLAIFTHHLDTRDILAERLNQQFEAINKEIGETLFEPVLVLAGSKDTVEVTLENFKNSKQRVIVLSTLSHGESLNLQFCSDSILHERQWNPANEDQAISGRFRRIGQTFDAIRCMILVAIGTIDEYFADLVEQKREYFESTMQGRELEQSWDESSLIMQLAETLASKGRRKWKLQ
jgi:SNF2 family DNA or RNA helicase